MSLHEIRIRGVYCSRPTGHPFNATVLYICELEQTGEYIIILSDNCIKKLDILKYMQVCMAVLYGDIGFSNK